MYFFVRHYRGLLEATLLLTLIVVALGAYVRLSDAGLGCPDWPGCYGQLWAPDQLNDQQKLDYDHSRVFDPLAAQQEMIHRLVAGLLGILLFVLAFVAWRKSLCPPWLPLGLMALLSLQVVLGMLTVSWLLKPIAVTSHLFGGFALAALLWLMHACDRRNRPNLTSLLPLTSKFKLPTDKATSGDFRVALLAVTGALLMTQIFLGVWMSSHYASLACIDFPTCHGLWLPAMDLSGAFTLWQGLGVNYEYGALDHEARTAIHWLHRVNALLFSLWSLPVMIMLSATSRLVRLPAMVFILLVGVQLTLGVVNVIASLPIVNAVAHTVVALLLVLSWLEVVIRLWPSGWLGSVPVRAGAADNE